MTNKILDDINEAINNHTEDHTKTEMWIHEDAWEEMLKNKEEILDEIIRLDQETGLYDE